MIVVTPRRRWSCLISWRRCTRTFASSAESGSSSNKSPGEVASARASATRCCWPPESCAGYFVPCALRPIRSSSSRTRRPRVLEPVGDVLGGGQIGKQRIGLEHDAEVALGRRQGRDVSAVLLDAAGGLDIEARDRAQERRLAATRRPQEADELALGDLE